MCGDLYIHAHWGSRKESIEKCADRLTSFLGTLAHCDDRMQNWFELGKSRRHALRKRLDSASRAQVLALLDRGRLWTDYSRELIEDGGFGVHLWNGSAEGGEIGLSILCGSYETVMPAHNSVVIDLPKRLGEFANGNHSLKVVAAVAKAWEPDWVELVSNASVESRPYTAGKPFVDWMLYLPTIDMNTDKMPPSASFHRVDNLGTIVVVQDTPIDPANRTHTKTVSRVAAALGLG